MKKNTLREYWKAAYPQDKLGLKLIDEARAANSKKLSHA